MDRVIKRELVWDRTVVQCVLEVHKCYIIPGNWRWRILCSFFRVKDRQAEFGSHATKELAWHHGRRVLFTDHPRRMIDRIFISNWSRTDNRTFIKALTLGGSEPYWRN